MSRDRALTEAGVGALCVSLALLWLWPLPPYFASRIPHDPGDPVLNTWILWWNSQAVPFTETWWNAPIFFPMRGALALSFDDANIDVTYGQRDGAFGPDEVGVHVGSTSPFGLVDTAGNVWEILRSSTGSLVLRGGSYYMNKYTAYIANRGETITPTHRHVLTGARICADL